MSNPRDRRIAKELADMHSDKDQSGIIAVPVSEGNLTNLVGSLPGPPDTPYTGATYQIDIVIPDRYPFAPPKMKFRTKIWHPNVSSVTGAICLDTLTSGWSPVQTIKVALMSCQALLESPNPKDPQDAEVAAMMVNQPTAFTQKARSWAIEYASAPDVTIDLNAFIKSIGGPEAEGKQSGDRYQGYPKPMVDKFLEMGFQIEAIIDAFKELGIDKNHGIAYEPYMPMGWQHQVMARLIGE